MGKGIAKHGFKSGILPTTRAILKKPTVKQQTLVEKAKQPLPKGKNGVGYADNVKHPRGSRRVPLKPKFLEVEQLIAKTVPAPQKIDSVSTPQQAAKLKKSELRRRYLAEAFRKEEQKLILQEEYMMKKQKELDMQRQNELKELEQEKSSDLTIPTLSRILSEPLMRQRTQEEKELLDMKRKYNRDLVELKAKERKLDDLLKLYHVSDEFIVTEKQLLDKVEEAFSGLNSDFIRENYAQRHKILNNRYETSIGDAMFGTVNSNSHVGLPVVKDFLNGELQAFAQQVIDKSKEALKEQQQQLNNLQQ